MVQGVFHTNECRARVEHAMESDPVEAERKARDYGRIAEDLARRIERATKLAEPVMIREALTPPAAPAAPTTAVGADVG